MCERLYELEATVYAISRSPDPLKELKEQCPNVTILSVNLSNWNETKTQLTRLLNGVKIDGLVNNAGIAIIKPFADLTEKDFDE